MANYRSKEWRRKQRLAHLGKKASRATRRKMSRSAKKVKRTAEWNKNVSIGKLKSFREHPELRQKLSLAKMGHPVSEKTRRKLVLSHKGQIPWNRGKTGIYSKEYLEQMSKKITKHHNLPEVKRKLSKLKYLQYRKRPNLRKKISKGVTKMYEKHPEVLTEQGKNRKIFWKTHPSARKEQSKKHIEFYVKHPEARELESKRQILHKKKHPEEVARQRKHLLETQKKHPELLEKFMAAPLKLVKPTQRTKFGFPVRSNPEKLIANWLYHHKIKCLYERPKIHYAGGIIVPDFFLPKYNVYIEYFGRFRGNITVERYKPRIYRKLRLKLLALYPKDLNNLDLILGKKLKHYARMTK
jgi:hypothetical protein